MKKYLPNSIITAVTNDDLNTIQKFLKRHAKEPDALNAREKPVKKWTLFGNSEILEPHGDTMLHLALRQRTKHILKELVACKLIDVNVFDLAGQTPLHLAVQYDNPVAVNLLLSAPGIEVNKLDSNGRTPVMLAAMMGRREIVEALLNHGANPMLLSCINANDAAKEAEAFCHDDVAQLIRGHMSYVAAKFADRPQLKRC